VTLRGTVAEQPRKRGQISGGVYFRRDISIRTPHDAQYRVDGGAWQPLTAVDGAFDEPQEPWTLTTEALTPGPHDLDLQATTGEAATRSRILWAGDTPVDLAFATNATFTKTTASVKAGKAARVYVRSTSDGRPVSSLGPVKLVRASDQRVIAVLTTGEDGVWSGTIPSARTRTYTLRFAGAGRFLAPSVFPRVTIKVK
jgi:hypothetical protein